LSAVITDSAELALEAGSGSHEIDYGYVPKPQPFDQELDIYNAAHSGPYVASNFNPLVELSWKDLETVYNYRVSNLMAYSRNIQESMKPGDSASKTGANGDRQPKFADFIDPDILSMLPTDEEMASLQNFEAAVYMSHDETEVLPSLDQSPLKYLGIGAFKTGDDSLSQINGADPEINSLPRFGDGEAVLDLDAMDIFDDLGDLADLSDIEGSADVDISDDLAQSGDELRQLIKGRIQQASEIQSEVTPRRMGTGGSGSPEQEPQLTARSRNKFVGGAKSAQDPKQTSFVVRQIPPEIRKASLILGLRPEEITTQAVVEAWKKQIASPGVHPDLGGDTEAAVYLNTAKDTLVRWIEAQAPKLGKKFGNQGKEMAKPPLQTDQG
jgi:hypothetical protein